jgi:hypothetical protein
MNGEISLRGRRILVSKMCNGTEEERRVHAIAYMLAKQSSQSLGFWRKKLCQDWLFESWHRLRLELDVHLGVGF